ncbi:MAG TPA: PH domain-containing protein [Nitrospiria bacterium]|nr:PH domain-containing protein [Nitrospiria bacterium]
MRCPAAPTALAIKIVTGFVLVLTASFFILSRYRPELSIVGLILAVLSLGCYLRAPVAYDLSNSELTVVYRLGERRFKPVVGCSLVDTPFSIAIRLWGNGGLFAGTGIFWNRTYGVFRAYVTRAKPTEMVLVETEKQKILISPDHPGRFVDAAGFSKPASGPSSGHRPNPTASGPRPRASG